MNPYQINEDACVEFGGPNTFLPDVAAIELTQQGPDHFRLRYGLSDKQGLTYTQAAHELGAAIMHYQSCGGIIDNRTRAEARKDGDA